MNDFKSIAKDNLHEIDKLLEKYKVVRYPGKKILQEGKSLIEQILDYKEPVEFFKNVFELEDDLLDYGEDSEDVYKFFKEGNPQKKNFDTAIDKIKHANNNMEYLDEEAKNIVEKRFDRNDVNTERFGNEKAAAAEELIISILLRHPDQFDNAAAQISAEDFVTSLNKRIFTAVCEDIKNNRNFSISTFEDRFSDKEIGLIVKLLNSEVIGNGPKETLMDCIKVLKKEKEISKVSLNDDDWATQMQKIAEDKKGN